MHLGMRLPHAPGNEVSQPKLTKIEILGLENYAKPYLPVLDVRAWVLTAEHTEHDQHHQKEEGSHCQADSVDRQVANEPVTWKTVECYKVITASAKDWLQGSMVRVVKFITVTAVKIVEQLLLITCTYM